METQRCSLMTFMLEIDIVMKKLTATQCLQLAQDAGLGFVDLMDVQKQRAQQYCDAAKRVGIRPMCYIGTVSFFSNSEEKIEQTLRQQLALAASLGAQLYMIVPMDARRDAQVCHRLGPEAVRARLKRYFSLAVELAKGLSLRACFETTPRTYTRLSGIEDCRWILEQVPGLGLVYDTANMLPAGDEPLAYYEALKPYIIHTHLKDVTLRKPGRKDRLFCAEQTGDGRVMQCCITGEGVIPLREILARMERDGYSGTYALEYCHPSHYPADFAANAAQLRKHLDFFA